MATIDLPVPISDSSVSDGTNPGKSGLTPAVLSGIKLADGTAATVGPTFTAGPSSGANGLYCAHYDPEANGEALFLVDAGSGLAKNADRFFYLVFTRDSGRLLGSLPTAAPNASGGLPTVGTGTGQIALANGQVTAADAGAGATLSLPAGAVTSATSTQVVATMSGLGSAVATDDLKGRRLIITSGTRQGEITDGCSGCAISGQAATFAFAAAQRFTLSAGDTFAVGGY